MLRANEDCASVAAEVSGQQTTQPSEALVESPQPVPAELAQSIRSSLKASTLDAVFAAVFLNIAGGVLLSNFLVDLDASTVEIGVMAAIPMLVNLIQPLGAYLADRTTSRHRYGLRIFAPSRLVWLVLVFGIALSTWNQTNSHLLIYWTLGVTLISHILAALGSASWLSWLAALVPRQLRGRYFGFRNSTSSLTILICVPLAGLGISAWPGGPIQGYGVVLLLGIVAGTVSIGFQFFMRDVNPQQQLASGDRGRLLQTPDGPSPAQDSPARTQASIWQDTNFLIFLLYFGVWAFSINLSSPFFNIYLLDNLGLDVRWVTLYNSLASASTLLMLVLWGRLSDQVGNRPLLLLVGILVAVTPLLWLGIGNGPASLWIWLPLLHIFIGSTWAAIELCSNNIQLAIAPIQQHSSYFAIAAAVAGGAGALGTVAGGCLAQLIEYRGIVDVFVISSILRLLALLPLVLVHEQQGQSLIQIFRALSAGSRPLLDPLPEKTLKLDELNRKLPPAVADSRQL